MPIDNSYCFSFSISFLWAKYLSSQSYSNAKRLYKIWRCKFELASQALEIFINY